DQDAQVVAIASEATRELDPHALLDIEQDLLIAGLVTDQQQPQTVVLHHLERLARHVGLGVAGPGDPELAELAGQSFDARYVIGQRVIVEEDLPHLWEGLLGPFHLGNDILDRAHTIAMPADRLRPQAEGAARLAATARIERDVRVLEIAAEIILDLEIAFVD